MNYIMAEQNDPELADVMKMLEVEPAQPIEAPGPDIPALREQLAILVSTGKCKEAIGTQLTHDQVKRRSACRAEKRLHHHKRAVLTVWWSCIEMRPYARSCQRVSDHSKTC